MSVKKVIVFEMAEKEYVVGVDVVRSIEKMQSITRVPGTAPYVKGVMNLRGIVTPILDLRLRFGLKGKEATDDTRMIMISYDEKEMGLIVDRAHDVLDIDERSIELAPEAVGSTKTELIHGIANVNKRLLLFIELEEIIKTAS
ncbi:chemotaxis protein CheW [Bacillus fonticola]|uniref:chemotaxis protein CheW n=1 Tax=Bacillus fonticola TaxID=2728853 RepID=UPI00147361F8|nr:chemotaxis protein CheW [Bacillus fonticola]